VTNETVEQIKFAIHFHAMASDNKGQPEHHYYMIDPKHPQEENVRLHFEAPEVPLKW
jgi:hypothetical protein